MARAKKNDNVDKKMKIKRQKNAISASNSRAQKREEYEAAKNAVKLQKDLHDETIEVANEILSEFKKAVGMMKVVYEENNKMWTFENEFNIVKFRKDIRELNSKQQQIDDYTEKSNSPMKRLSIIRIDEKDLDLITSENLDDDHNNQTGSEKTDLEIPHGNSMLYPPSGSDNQIDCFNFYENPHMAVMPNSNINYQPSSCSTSYSSDSNQTFINQQQNIQKFSPENENFSNGSFYSNSTTCDTMTEYGLNFLNDDLHDIILQEFN